MSRYTHREVCGEAGCNETAFFAADTRKEQAALYARYLKTPWKCVRHSRPDEVLSTDNPAIETVLEIYETDFGMPSPYRPPHKFWTELENVAEQKGGNGFKHGPGFKAMAEDFPVGTRLIVTARVELPAARPFRDTDAPKET